MEFKAFLETFKKYYLLIGLFTALGAIISLTYALKVPAGTKIDQTFYIVSSPKNPSGPPATEIDIYTQNQNARNFTDTATALAQSPDFTQAFRGASESISVRKLAPQIIKVTVTAPTIKQSQKLLGSFEEQFNQKITNLDPAAGVSIKPVGIPPNAYSTKLDPKTITLFGAFLGFVFAIFAGGIKTYLKL